MQQASVQVSKCCRAGFCAPPELVQPPVFIPGQVFRRAVFPFFFPLFDFLDRFNGILFFLPVQAIQDRMCLRSAVQRQVALK